MRSRQLSLLFASTLSLIGLTASAASAHIVPAPLFTDGAVLQQKQSDPVWGTADPGESITVTINGQTATAKANDRGDWVVRLKPIPAGGPYTLTIAGSAGDTVTLNDILVGEVWVCSGQSNMEFALSASATGPAAIAAAADPQLHFVIVPHNAAQTPQTTVKARWQAATPADISHLTAVGYFFGRDLRKTLNVPIGLIESSWGGTTAEAWTSRPTLEADPNLKYLADSETSAFATYPDRLNAYNQNQAQIQKRYEDAQAKYAADKAKYDADAAAARAAGTTPPPPPTAPQPPKPPADPATQPLPTHLYNGMIAPLIPYGIRGVIWYQGEQNTGRAFEYQNLFPTMISNWRKDWGQGDFPFLLVQLAPFQPIIPKPQGSNWAELREAQREALKLPRTGMVVITDLGDQKTIHPKRKEPIGDRLALAAQALVYGAKNEYTGPVLESSRVEGSKVRLTFSHADGLRPGEVRDGADNGDIVAPADHLVGFTIAGADQQFYPADAVIEGNSVIVSSASVPSPVAVRYGWATYPVANLQNSAGLWASPFRTDDWSWVTTPKARTAAK